jgi:hypothetical protein
MNTDIENWITGALDSLNLKGRKMTAAKAADIHSHALCEFVAGSPRAWWLSLKTRPTLWSNNDKMLHELVDDKNAQGWFIPETGEDNPPVYRLSANEAELIVRDCPFFEYYFLDEQITVLVIENDHNEFLVCRNNNSGNQ